MPNAMILTGAYGRAYATAAAALEDWRKGMDFKIDGGPYCSIRDYDTLTAYGMDVVLAYGYNKHYTLFRNATVDRLAGII